MYLFYNLCTNLHVSNDHFVHHQEFMIYCICSSVQTVQTCLIAVSNCLERSSNRKTKWYTDLPMSSYISLISALDGVQWPASAAGRFNPCGITVVTTVGFEPETPQLLIRVMLAAPPCFMMTSVWNYDLTLWHKSVVCVCAHTTDLCHNVISQNSTSHSYITYSTLQHVP